MRRSGITSRSKCAIFSSSQMSCSSAGPRGPAVMMLVLSATGAPVALVKTFDVDMSTPRLAITVDGIPGCTQRCGEPNVQYRADFPDPSGGKTNLENFRFEKVLDFLSFFSS